MVLFTSATFNFLTSAVLVSLQAYDGGGTSSTVTLSCSGNNIVTQSVAAGALRTITTNWATPCTTITIGSSNNWWTNFDNLVYTN